jgi:hypothetical protein
MRPMKSAETLLACCVVGLACFIGGQAVGVRHAAVHDEAGGTIAARSTRTVARPAADARARAPLPVRHVDEILVRSAEIARFAGTPDDRRRRIALGTAGTYIDEILLARDSALARWPERIARPLRVYVGDGRQLEGWTDDFLPAVRDAFDSWVRASIPVRFTFVPDTTDADIRVRFVSTFDNGISGKTVWSRDGYHWLLSSDIQLAVTHPNGGSVSAPQMRAIALHEVGHLLGLDHSSDGDNIMSARVRVRELSEADRATVRLLYAVPAGSIKAR